jgi:hypothetical protein
MSHSIHGLTDPQEIARREHQAAFIAERALCDFSARPGDLVLDLGTGVGAMVGQRLGLLLICYTPVVAFARR